MTIESLSSIDDLEALLSASVSEGYRFVTRLVSDYRSGSNRFDQRGELLLIARSDDGIVSGVCGLNATSKANVARVRRFYVLPAMRSRGIGAALLEQIISAARLHFTTLELRSGDPRAAAFYVSHGFRSSQREDATHELELKLLQSAHDRDARDHTATL